MILYGSGGHGKVIAEAILKSNEKLLGVFDDQEQEFIYNIDYLGRYEKNLHAEEKIIISIGNNTVRQKLVGEVNHHFGVVIHPQAYVSPTASIEEGTVVLVNSIINTDSKIGKHCIINSNATVDHDNKIGDFVHIAPGATLCGHVEIGDGTLVGAGATVAPGVIIGKNVLIELGANVTENVPDNHQFTRLGHVKKIL